MGNIAALRTKRGLFHIKSGCKYHEGLPNLEIL